MGKGLRKTPNHPDMVFKGFIKFTGLPESKNGKNSHLKILTFCLRKTPNHPDMVFKGFIKFTGLPESKTGKNSHLKIFDILLKTRSNLTSIHWKMAEFRLNGLRSCSVILGSSGKMHSLCFLSEEIQKYRFMCNG